jgi:hypothetical protein
MRQLAQERWRWASHRPWRAADNGEDGGLLLWRVPWLDDASWSFFIFFSQDGIFMVLALALTLWECDASGAYARQLIKH